MTQIAVRLFGYPTLESGGGLVPVERQRTLALAAYLGATGERVGRDRLAALLWPGYDREQARAYLRHSLWELRRALGEPALRVDRQTARLDPDRVAVDVVRFRELMRRRRATPTTTDALALLEEAVALYRGDFLAGFSLPDGEEFDDWQVLEAESLRRELLEALEALSRIALASGDHERAVAAALRWLQADPLDERAHRAAMSAHAASGQRALAVRQYHLCVETLRRELDAEPEPATQALYEHIRALEPDAVVPPATPPTPTRPPLPELPLTPLLGRESEMAEIARHLADPGCRLLTLLGPGGVGKTRLALEAAHALAEGFRDGALVVQLESLPGPQGLAGAIARAAAVPGPGAGRPATDEATRLIEHLRERQLLVVLDNMEHLLDGAPLVERLLAAAPELKLLVTSRERLNLLPEWVLEVRGLACPPGAEAAERYPAARLFLSGARRNVAGYAPGAEEWPAIVRLCRFLEGLPLGLEMAAAWMRLLPVEEIAAELERNLDFLAGTWRGAPERHRSLRAVFEQSWSLLPPAEQRTLARLSLFRGGFTREAAAATAAAGPPQLVALVDRSLLERRGDGRYHLHPALRQYAAEKLSLGPDDEARSRSQHCLYYMGRLADVGARLMSVGEDGPLLALAADVPDLQAAWEAALQSGPWEAVRGAVPGWALFHEITGHWEEGFRAFSAAIDPARQEAERDTGPPSRALLALILAVAGRFGMAQPHPSPSAAAALVESRSLAQELDDGREVACALLLNSIGGRLPAEESLASCRRSQGIFATLGDRWAEALARLVWADTANLSAHDYEAAWAEYRAAHDAFSGLGNDWGRALCCNGMSMVAQEQDRLDEAERLGREALAVFAQVGDLRRELETRERLARVCWGAGRSEAARGEIEAAVDAVERAGHRSTVPWLLTHGARLAAAHGEHDQAQRWLDRSLEHSRRWGDRRGEERALRALEELRRSAGGPEAA